ncbi:hypothetical protein I302_108929 [Kwoniella bestiolae CBS 10118]|uniref:Uncharacterized protein n=1 Tax=Kwoniella bestiolae CBS 10118 TaxID=1296100 RepID=A0A1B9FUH6_9TREE|nr:hypothetical protein I302_08070 [Kwoniella bestiolae CBS 10118]OCF22422.1 hypothetical protein I302_08070 [Kwoniella bestiolae CBS 10118]
MPQAEDDLVVAESISTDRLGLTNRSRLQPRPSRFNSTSITHMLSLYTSSYHAGDMEPPTDSTIIPLDDDQHLKSTFNCEQKFSLCPWATHTRVIQAEERRIHGEALRIGADFWGRRANDRQEKTVTENTLDYIHQAEQHLGSFFGRCDPRDGSGYTESIPVSFDLVAHQCFSLSSLSEEVTFRLKENDLFARFRNIEFTVKSKVPDSLFQSFKDDLQPLEGVSQGDGQRHYRVRDIPVQARRGHGPELTFQTSWMDHLFEIEWDIDSPQTQVLSLYDAETSKEALRTVLQGDRSSLIGVSKVDVEADSIVRVRQRLIRQMALEEPRQELARQRNLREQAISTAMEDTRPRNTLRLIDQQRAWIRQAEANFQTRVERLSTDETCQ